MRLRRPYARIEVALPGPGRAAVRCSFPGGGTARGMSADRLDLVLGLLAWAVHRTHEDAVPGLAESVRVLATAIADSPDGAIPLGTIRAASRSAGPVDVRLEEWPPGRGGVRVREDLVRSAVGPVPVIRSSPAPPVLALAALAAGAWEAGHEDAHGRLAVALSIEGLVAWYREAHRLTAPRDAVQAARAHAVDRLVAAGRSVPPVLTGTAETDFVG